MRSLLAGRISGADGNLLTPVHANKQGRHYRYHVTRPSSVGRKASTEWRLPAGEIDRLVIHSIVTSLDNQHALASLAAEDRSLPDVLERAANLITKLSTTDSRTFALVELDPAATVEEHRISISLSRTIVHPPTRM